jgi:uncharacterized protein YegL
MENKINVVFLLDRSGSMHNSVEDTIGGYNSYLEKERKNTSLITTILFDDEYEVLHYRKESKDIKKLTKKEYFVRGCTALYDAIGKTIRKLEHDVKDEKVLFIITTDGLENASKEYNKKSISKLIKKHKDWEFIYLGADIDSYAEGESIGISRDRISNFKKSREGIKEVFDSVVILESCLAKNEEISSRWKEKLEK